MRGGAKSLRMRMIPITVAVLMMGLVHRGSAAMPDHPIVTEVFQDPVGLTDGPVGRDPSNLHQSFIEIYLPPASDLRPGLDPDALRLTFYEVEGDVTSPGLGLVNYRIDLPPFDVDPTNGITPGAIARPPSGVVVIGWVDYLGSPPVDLLGTPDARVALVDGGITAAGDFTFVALNGGQFSGTTNFPVPEAVSSIDLPLEATSGIIQNGSGVYLLVDRDDPGYVELFDDEAIPAGGSADPDLPGGTVLGTSALLDAYATNDDDLFDPNAPPHTLPGNRNVDLVKVLPSGGAYTLLAPQVPFARGHQRLFGDLPKTTEDADPLNDDPIADFRRYRPIDLLGPLGLPSPGRALFTTSPPELALARESLQILDVIAGTTSRPGMRAANAGGDFAMQASATPGPSSDPSIVSVGPGEPDVALQGQTTVSPRIEATAPLDAIDGSTATALLTVNASTVDPADPPTLNPLQTVDATFRVLNPTTGSDPAGLPFQATTFAALQGLQDDPFVLNEFPATSLGRFVAANLGGIVKDDRGNAPFLLSPFLNLSDSVLMDQLEDDMPTDPLAYINPLSSTGEDLRTVVLGSAEVLAGWLTYSESTTATGVRALELTIPETRTHGGIFSPTERVHFVDPGGRFAPGSPFLDSTTTRGFELALIDTNAVGPGRIESGSSDDFGLVVQVGLTEPGAAVIPGEFVFLSYLGGLEGADIDGVDVPPHGSHLVIVYLDLDPLHSVLGIDTIRRLYVVDAGSESAVNLVEVFSLNAASAVTCGNGILDPGEECDGAGETATCDSNCTFAQCGDGTLNTTAGESCDTGGASATCDADCTPALCGDGVLNPFAGELCDDGNGVPGDGCEPDCTPSPDVDGDGVPDGLDTCPFVPNPDQTDTNLDGIGDPCQCGDVDGDGFTNVADALLIARGQVDAASPHFPKCDVNGDGGCNTVDALLIARGEVSADPAGQLCPAYAGTIP